MALKYHTYAVVTGYKFFQKICSSDINLVSGYDSSGSGLTGQIS